MKAKHYYNVCAGLVFIVIFSTVAPVNAWASDTSFITNVTYTSQSTGGQSSKGADGQDGQDGEDGKHGEDGKPGTSGGSVVTGNSTSEMHIESSLNGEKIIDVHTAQVSSSETLNDLGTSAPTTSGAGTEDATSFSGDADVPEQNVSALRQAVQVILLMLQKYVNLLF